MVIDEFYKSLLVLLNKNQMGKISPSDFNAMIFEAQKKISVEIFASFRKLDYRRMRLNSTTNYGNEAFNNKQAIEYYITEDELTLDKAKAVLPEDVLFVNSVFDDNTDYNKVDLMQFNRLTKSKRMQPSICNAIYTLMNNHIKIAPEADKISIVYYRIAKQPRWTYRIVEGVEMFNPDAEDFQDIDLHESLHPMLFTDVLHMSGLNLRENDVAQYVAQVSQQDNYNAQ